MEFLEGGKYVRYKERKFFVFDESMSNGTEHDYFTGVNLPVLVSYKGLYFTFKNKKKNSILSLAKTVLNLILFDVVLPLCF